MTTCPDLWLLLGVGAGLLVLASWSKQRRASRPPAGPVVDVAPHATTSGGDRSLGAA
ncbi:MAG: hypothetical protein ACK501_07810 [Planctomycetota bacterium]